MADGVHASGRAPAGPHSAQAHSAQAHSASVGGPRAERPIWRDGAFLTFVAAVVTIAPTTALGVTQYFVSRRQHDLTVTEQRFKLRERYLDRALASQGQLEQRELVLRFLTEVAEDAPMREWAARELKRVEQRIGVLRKERTNLEKQVAAVWAEYEETDPPSPKLEDPDRATGGPSQAGDSNREGGTGGRVRPPRRPNLSRKQSRSIELKAKLRALEQRAQHVNDELGAAKSPIVPATAD